VLSGGVSCAKGSSEKIRRSWERGVYQSLVDLGGSFIVYDNTDIQGEEMEDIAARIGVQKRMLLKSARLKEGATAVTHKNGVPIRARVIREGQGERKGFLKKKNNRLLRTLVLVLCMGNSHEAPKRRKNNLTEKWKR